MRYCIQTTIEALKAELAALEVQYATMLTKTTWTPAVNADDDESLLVKYTQLTAAKNRLREENDALYELNASRMMAADRIHQLLRTETPLPRVATPFRFRSLPAAEYSQLIVEARDDVLRFIHAPDKLSTGASVFGWTDQRQVVGDTLKFALEKRFVGVSAVELLERSWRIFASPTVFPQIYTASLNVRFVELERVNDDAVLFYRTINADGSNVCVKVLFVLSRLKLDEGGYMLVFRSLDRTRLRFHEDEIYEVVAETRALGQTRQELWVDKYIWVIFRDSEDKEGGCDFHFGGATTTSIWLQEVLFIALRWESLAVGPQFSLMMD